jgi:hypothetical protein
MQLNAIALQLNVKMHNSLPRVKQETNIVTHGKFVDFHSSNMDENNSTKIELPYN